MNDNIIPEVKFYDLGIQSYKIVWSFQKKLVKKIINLKSFNKTKKKIYHYFIFVEHPNIYTLGKNGNIKNLLINYKKLQSIGVDFLKVDRGGDITYHGLGQLLCYPILDLEYFKKDISWYLLTLEKVIIQTLQEYNIISMSSKKERGIWIDINTPLSRKICSFGIRLSRWVTMHGLALNVNTNLKYFQYIIPCGIKNKSVTSIENELKKKINMEEVKQKIKYFFIKNFNLK